MRWKMLDLVAAPISRLGIIRCGKYPVGGASCKPFVSSMPGHDQPIALSFMISGKSLAYQ